MQEDLLQHWTELPVVGKLATASLIGGSLLYALRKVNYTYFVVKLTCSNIVLVLRGRCQQTSARSDRQGTINTHHAK
jgi:hypothetical protein